MKTRIWIILICALTFNVSEASERGTGSQQRNLSATRDYYSRLVSGPTVRLADLTLFTNMMPKGGDLHHHYSGAIYAETYLDWVDAQAYCIYSVTDPSLKIKKFTIEAKPQEQSEAARALCLSANELRGNDSLYRELLQVWSDKDYDNHFHQQAPPDKQFFDTFSYFGPVSGYSYNEGLKSLKARAQAENVSYLETMLKGSPAIANDKIAALLNGLNQKSSPQQIDDALAAAYDLLSRDRETDAKIDSFTEEIENAAAGIDDNEFRLRFQTYVTRNLTPAEVFSRLYTSFAADKRSGLLVGVNIVGPENGYVALRDYSLHMKMFAFLKKRFPNAKLSLHAGELTVGMVTPESLRSHIREAILVAGADRIGHGVDIPHETEAVELLGIMRQRKIPVEINLTSNAFILGVKDEAHPVQLYRTHQVPVVISTDDAGVSRNNLSSEYLLYTSRYKPGYDELKEVVYNSIRYSFLSAEEKREEMAKLDKRFRDFERRVAALPPAKPLKVTAERVQRR